MCRRQATAGTAQLVRTLARLGLALHGFGVKTSGLARFGPLLASVDSMSWSRVARWEHTRLPGCTHVGDCRNCPRWALAWRAQVLAQIAGRTPGSAGHTGTNPARRGPLITHHPTERRDPC